MVNFPICEAALAGGNFPQAFQTWRPSHGKLEWWIEQLGGLARVQFANDKSRRSLDFCRAPENKMFLSSLQNVYFKHA
jgi:hypothetical protein